MRCFEEYNFARNPRGFAGHCALEESLGLQNISLESNLRSSGAAKLSNWAKKELFGNFKTRAKSPGSETRWLIFFSLDLCTHFGAWKFLSLSLSSIGQQCCELNYPLETSFNHRANTQNLEPAKFDPLSWVNGRDQRSQVSTKFTVKRRQRQKLLSKYWFMRFFPLDVGHFHRCIDA